jgi:hypothetical protein
LVVDLDGDGDVEVDATVDEERALPRPVTDRVADHDHGQPDSA